MTAGHSSKRSLRSSQQHTNKTKHKKKKERSISDDVPFLIYTSFLPDELVDCLVKLFDGVKVVLLDGIDDACGHVFLEDHTADRFDG